VSFREPNGAVMTNMKSPQEGRNTQAPSLRGLQGRSATGLNGQAAKEEVSAMWRGGWLRAHRNGDTPGSLEKKLIGRHQPGLLLLSSTDENAARGRQFGAPA
jgi:hypothetical protein